MEAQEILKKAWEAVQAAGIPEPMHDTAFREAVAILRGEPGPTSGSVGQQSAPTSTKGAKRTAARSRKRQGASADATPASTPVTDEATFFQELSHESGVAETDLRDVISLSSTGHVHVTPATRTLGTNRAEQARTVTAIVAVARGIGLGEMPIDADAVRQEVDRKRCFDSGNYASTVVSRLRGVNYGGSRGEMVLTSRWVDDFVAAINQAHGRAPDAEE